MTKKPIIQLKNVWKIYQMGEVAVNALKNVSLDIFPGEFVAILGSSGSGKCVSGETQLISDDGIPIEIKNFENNKTKILALDKKKGKIRAFSVSKFHKRNVETVLNVKTAAGRIITVTKEHPFFTINENGFSEIPANNLRKGMFIATPRKTNHSGSSQYLSSLNKLSKDKSLIISNSIPLVRKAFKGLNISRKNICNKFNFKLNTYDCWLSKNNISLSNFKEILNIYGKSINDYEKRIKLTALSSNKIINIPINTTPELLEFYGFLVGDGNMDFGGIKITNIDQDLKARIKYLANAVFGIKSTESVAHRIDCNSRVLRSFFNLVFNVPLKNKSRKVKLPAFVFRCSNKELAAFIKGLFDCDSYVSKSKKEISIVLASETLIKQLLHLFLRFGIVARYSEKIKYASNTKKKIRRKYYSLSISGFENVRLYHEFIGFNLKKKRNRLNKHILGKSDTNVDVIPCGTLIRNIRVKSTVKLSRKIHRLLGPYERLKINPSIKKLTEIIKIFEINGINPKELKDLTNMEVFWDRIISINKKNKKTTVYDLTVPGADNFVANNFIIHNSTMMNQVGILDVPTKGQILLEGKDISTFDESNLAQLRGKKIGFVFQQFNLIPTLTALENVTLPTIFQNVSEVERTERAKKLLDLFGLGDRIHHKPNELSGGQQQRVAIARALVNDPEIILADEPTGNLDSKSGRQVMNMLTDLHSKERKTIILVTHDIDLVKYTQKIIFLKDGEIIKVQQNMRK